MVVPNLNSGLGSRVREHGKNNLCSPINQLKEQEHNCESTILKSAFVHMKSENPSVENKGEAGSHHAAAVAFKPFCLNLRELSWH